MSCAELGLINVSRSDIQQKWKPTLQKGLDRISWIRVTQLPWWIGDGPNTDQVEFRSHVCVQDSGLTCKLSIFLNNI